MPNGSDRSFNFQLPSLEIVDQVFNEIGLTTPMGLKRLIEGLGNKIVELESRVTKLEIAVKNNRVNKRTKRKTSRIKPNKSL